MGVSDINVEVGFVELNTGGPPVFRMRTEERTRKKDIYSTDPITLSKQVIRSSFRTDFVYGASCTWLALGAAAFGLELLSHFSPPIREFKNHFQQSINFGELLSVLSSPGYLWSGPRRRISLTQCEALQKFIYENYTVD